MKLSLAKRKSLLKALDLIYNNGPTEPWSGICLNLQDVLKHRGRLDTYKFVSTVSMLWEGRDTDAELTVVDGVEYVSWPIRREYDSDGRRLPYWEGDQLCKRTALLEFLIDYLKNYKD